MNTVNEHEEYATVEQRKRNNRRIVITILSIFVGFVALSILLSLFLNFALDTDSATVDVYRVAYSRFGDAFATRIYWDCDADNTEFTVPDKFDIHNVTALGSSRYRFVLEPDDLHYSQGYRIYGDYNLDGNIQVPNDEYTECKITINLGKNISGFKHASLERWLVKADIPEDWREPEIYDIIYKIDYYFNVDPENKTFYAENGVVYWRETGEPVEELMM